MTESIDWKTAYNLWERGSMYFPQGVFNRPVADPVFVKYKNEYLFFGYDWLTNEDAIERKELINNRPSQLILFTQPTNKGTIHTAQMLVEAKNAEEIAAIWIAATAYELSDYRMKNGIVQYARELYDSSVLFLRERFFLWHQAMRKLVPDILIPDDVLNSIQCKNAETLIGLIQTNTMMLNISYKILRYSSLSDEMLAKEHLRSLHL